LILALGLFEFSECIGLGFRFKRMAFPLTVDEAEVNDIADLTTAVRAAIYMWP
jgi:hypothetical protein